ncbi:SIMPL domain-containing protein [Salegentibacter chungangensis]|uniref:SIMPL domain-containing protein n=1 Tax=Salegentibacter chungangensis TaxID=1335724 RepID=A0ABW3NWC3_9FLAO
MKKLLFALIFLSAAAIQAQDAKPSPVVTVTGEGIVKVVPDQVLIKSRIEHEGDSAEQVKKENDVAVDKVIKFLKSKGIKEKNIQTDYVNLNKRYDYNDKTYSYVANQAISIRLDDIKDYESIMKGLLENGLNRIDGVQFKSSKMASFEAEARKKAVLDAKKKAEDFVEPLNQSLGKAISISEMDGNNYQPMYRMAEAVEMSDKNGSQETIAPGEMEIKVKVNVGFQLN